jgi:cell division protein FtsN
MNTVFSSHSPKRTQRGGLFLGLIIGLLVGLAAALAVAIYVTKVPVPFMNKGVTKSTAEQDAQESQKNKNWDPNAPLYGKNPAKPSASGMVGTATTAPTTSAVTSTAAKPTPAVSAAKPSASAVKPAASAAKPSADPLGDLAKAKTTGAGTATAATAGADPFTYFVQTGAFRTPEDAESQKAKLSIAGFEAKITEREQSGRTVFRVRVGPLDKQGDADKAKEKLDAAGFETAIVRVQR